MIRAMLFVDGRWLDTWGLRRLTQSLPSSERRTPFQIDFDALPEVVAAELGGGVEFVRKMFFSSTPVNLHPGDVRSAKEKIDRNEQRFAELRNRFRYEVSISLADYRGEIRMRKEDRKGPLPIPNPVPMALGAEAMFYAAMPSALDVAVFLVGDEVYRPTFRALRRMGKRVALATIREGRDPRLLADASETLDWKPIFIDNADVLDKVELRPRRALMECLSPLHRGDRSVWVIEGLEEPSNFCCSDCRSVSPPSVEGKSREGELAGTVSRIFRHGYGFILFEGKEYFFHASDLPPNTELFTLKENDRVTFRLESRPGQGGDHKRGRARDVTPVRAETR